MYDVNQTRMKRRAIPLFCLLALLLGSCDSPVSSYMAKKQLTYPVNIKLEASGAYKLDGNFHQQKLSAEEMKEVESFVGLIEANRETVVSRIKAEAKCGSFSLSEPAMAMDGGGKWFLLKVMFYSSAKIAEWSHVANDNRFIYVTVNYAQFKVVDGQPLFRGWRL